MRFMSRLAEIIPKRFRNSGDDGPSSIVLLLRQPHFFTKDELSAAAARAWDRTFEDSDQSRHFIFQSGLVTFVKVGPHVLNILHADRLYFGGLDPTDLKEFLPEPERQNAWQSHHAWCAVDYMVKDTDEDTKYSVLAALVAQMVDENCSGVWIPEFRSFIPNAAFNGILLYPALQHVAHLKEVDLN